ncbi:hypothetical protein E2C01_063188 [Portunus trituberculatus]|uniref:Uncharacterized protein n=1 Tax=Portunus trituberculatus TaxID=210409 RepID=A0A5B7HHF8_PORTR|nr:hypothetical protein [Portunus trituberculatus]
MQKKTAYGHTSAHTLTLAERVQAWFLSRGGSTFLTGNGMRLSPQDTATLRSPTLASRYSSPL